MLLNRYNVTIIKKEIGDNMEILDFLLPDRDNESSTGELSLVTSDIVDCNDDIAQIKNLDGSYGNLPITEFYPNKKWEIGKRYILLKKEKYGKITYSARDLNLIKLLIDGISPEVRSGDVRIIKIVREVGIRSKVAVASTSLGIDAIESCVGESAGRVRTLCRLLEGERIDFVSYNKDPETFIRNTLGVDIKKITFLENKVELEVPSHQYQAAVGGGGINSLISAKLTDYNLSIIEENLNEK
jgi:N utilization substance protein A